MIFLDEKKFKQLLFALKESWTSLYEVSSTMTYITQENKPLTDIYI